MYRMYLYHFTQITLKIQPVFKLLQKPHTILYQRDRRFVSAVRFSKLYITPPLFQHHYSLRTLFEVLKTHLGGQTYQKCENYEGFF